MTCHTQRNFTLMERATYRSIPGHPRWIVAPIEMAWEGKSIGEICRQIKDPARNGGRDLALLHEHLAHDDLVAWGWQPGLGRDPAPGSQAVLGELIQAWIDTGLCTRRRTASGCRSQQNLRCAHSAENNQHGVDEEPVRASGHGEYPFALHLS